MKKLFAFLLALCLCCTTAACGTVGDNTPETIPSSSVTEPTEAAPALNVWAIESAAITDYKTNAQTLWMEKLTGTHINWLAVPSSGWYSAFQASVMAGEAVDIYLYPFDTMEAEMLGTQMGYIIPLEDLITPETTPNIWAILEQNPLLREQITAPDGHIYTLFANDVYQLSAYTQKLWVNRSFLEQYTADTGCGLPQTTEEFRQMLCYFQAHDMNGDGALNEIPYIGVSGVDGMYNLFGSFLPSNSSGSGYGCYLDENGQLTFAYNQDAYKEALAYVRSLYEQGLISPDTFTTNPQERFALTSGEPDSVRAGVVTGVDASSVVRLTDGENTMTYDDYIPLPPLEGPEGVRTIVSTGETSVSLRNAITTQCADPVAAIRWLDAGYSEQARLFAVYGGLEEVDWNYAQGQTVLGSGTVITLLDDTPENASWNGQGIVYRVTEQDYLSMDAGQIGTNDALATYRANLAYRPYMVQNPWPTLVWAGSNSDAAGEYSELNSLIQKTVTEYYTDVILGRKDLDNDWNSYLQTLSDIGISRFLELAGLYITAAE